MFIAGSLILALTTSSFAFQEKIRLRKILNDDKIVVQRKDRNLYLLELGLGCRDISNYLGKKIRVQSSGTNISTVTGNGFTDISSKVILPNSMSCSVWSSKKLVTPRERELDQILQMNGIR